VELDYENSRENSPDSDMSRTRHLSKKKSSTSAEIPSVDFDRGKSISAFFSLMLWFRFLICCFLSISVDSKDGQQKKTPDRSNSPRRHSAHNESEDEETRSPTTKKVKVSKKTDSPTASPTLKKLDSVESGEEKTSSSAKKDSKEAKKTTKSSKSSSSKKASSDWQIVTYESNFFSFLLLLSSDP